MEFTFIEFVMHLMYGLASYNDLKYFDETMQILSVINLFTDENWMVNFHNLQSKSVPVWTIFVAKDVQER